MPTLVCVPITVVDEASALADARAARDGGADIVEYRIDEVFSGATDAAGHLDQAEVDAVLRLVSQSPLPCIITCRSSSEGGGYDGDDMARVSLYERLGTAGVTPGEHPPQYLDIEHAAYTRSANLRHKVDLAVDHPRQKRDVRTGLILSMHDFSGRPHDLLRRIAAMHEEPAARVVKVAITARSLRDNLELFDLLSEHAGKPMIALGMGRFGLMSRVLAGKFGALLTFAALRRASATAPGQPTIRDLIDLFNFRAIGPRTKVYGVVGWPVEHSLSPAVHNAGFEGLAAGEDRSSQVPGVYLPMPVPPEYEHFKATLAALIEHPLLDFAGCSVTLPHKQHLVRLADEAHDPRTGAAAWTWDVDALSRACGAANTLIIERDADGGVIRCAVRNTDADAAASVLAEALGGRLKDRRIALLGAGGVARAIAAGLLAAGASVLVINRTHEHAEALANDLRRAMQVDPSRITPVSEDALSTQPVDAVVNATPVGMTGGPSPTGTPIDLAPLAARSPGAVVFDTIYAPLVTPLLEQASLAGLRTIDGLEMFVRQAARQFEMWTGHPAPLSLYRRVCREAMGG